MIAEVINNPSAYGVKEGGLIEVLAEALPAVKKIEMLINTIQDKGDENAYAVKSGRKVINIPAGKNVIVRCHVNCGFSSTSVLRASRIQFARRT